MIEVCFTYASRKYWWTKLLRTGFSHCYAILSPDVGDKIVINPCFNKLYVYPLPEGCELPAELKKPCISVKIYTNTEPNVTVPYLMPYTCVEVMKRLIGLKDCRILTPYQLYRRLTNG